MAISRIAYQSTIWTSSGVLRKISTKSMAILASSQLEESRETPAITPITVAKAIATSITRIEDQIATRYITKREFVTPS